MPENKYIYKSETAIGLQPETASNTHIKRTYMSTFSKIGSSALYYQNLSIKDLPGEVWKPVLGTKYYLVSSYGRIKRLSRYSTHWSGSKVFWPESICKQSFQNMGYLTVAINQKKYLVHRIVATAFCLKEKGKNIINHIDENPKNNLPKNLEWCTQKHNVNHGLATKKRADKTKNHQSLSNQVRQIDETGKTVRVWPSTREAGRNGFECSSVCRCCNGILKTHKGFKWEYV